MKTILVPTDFSENAANALDYAAALVSQVGGKMIIAHIINLPVTPIGSSLIISSDEQLKEDCEQQLQKLSKELRSNYNFRFEVEIVCQYGYILANLNKLVITKEVDLIVMGTKGTTNFLNRIIGTNTSQFIKTAVCPVLAIPSEAKFSGIKHIAYASDFEGEETIFLQQLFRIAEPFGAEIAIINILTIRQLNIFSDNHVIRDITQKFTDNNYSIAQIQVENVIEGLEEFVQKIKADVLAVSIHERSFLEDLFHKSISKQIIYQATLPLLALPEKPFQKASLKAKKQKVSMVK